MNNVKRPPPGTLTRQSLYISAAMTTKQSESKRLSQHNFNFVILDSIIDNVLDDINPKKNEEKDDEKGERKEYNIKLINIDSKQLKIDKNPIGSGKFGTIFKGIWNNKTVAVKTHNNKKDYLHEANIIKHIKNSYNEHSNNVENENILKSFGICQQQIISEFMSFGSGDKLLYFKSDKNIRNNLFISDIIDILKDVCNGIKYLHSIGIIHRDLSARNLLFKPNNIENSKKYIVKLCDFGESVINKTELESRKGPYLWLSPETISKQICNIKTDIYSFGILCYELIIGVRPLSNIPIEIAIAEILCLEQRPNITLYNKLLPLQLFILIQLCWQTIPQYRPKDFYQILNYLNQIQKNDLYLKTRLSDIVFDENDDTKELLKDLKYIISVYLTDYKNNEYMTDLRNVLLKKIFVYKFYDNKNINIDAIEYYINYFPWGQKKTEQQRDKANQNIDQFMQKFGIMLYKQP